MRVPKKALPRRALATTWPVAWLLVLASGDAAATSQRWRCVMSDGSTHVVSLDLAQHYPALAHHCVALAGSTWVAFEDRAGMPALGRAPRVFAPERAPEETPAADAAATPQPQGTEPPQELAQLIGSASQRHGLDAGLVAAVMHTESRFQAGARSPKGALGLMQVMPATAARYGVVTERDLLDPRTNIEVGTRYLRDLQRLFGGRTELVLAAYNAGEGAVTRHGMTIPPYPETQAYVRRILARLGAGGGVAELLNR